ncbi:MAG: SH3 domain-containing protein [Balneolales bacterium]
MNKSYLILFLYPFLIFLGGCTSSNWIIQDEVALDRSQGELLTSSQFIRIKDMPTANRPVISFELYDRYEYSYPIRQKSRRYVQLYRPKYLHMLLGFGGAGMALYLANSAAFSDDDLSRNGKLALNSAGGILALTSLLNMKPIGDPLDTGEDKLLREIGEDTVVDTFKVTSSEPINVYIETYHNSELLKAGMSGSFQNGLLSFNLIDELGITGFDGELPGNIQLEIEHDNSVYTFPLQIDSFMEEFVTINGDNVPIRSAPSEANSNIITNIARDSQLKFVETVDENWYRILLGISPAFVSTKDAKKVWLPGNTDIDNLVSAPEESVFGDIDIERNLPETGQKKPNGVAVLIANGSYEQPLERFDQPERSLLLMKNYMINALGYSPENVVVLENAAYRDFRSHILQADSTRFFGREIIPDTTDLIVYYMGHSVADRRDEAEAYLLPVDYDPLIPSQRLISASRFLAAIGLLPTRSTTVLMETDFLLDTMDSQNPRGGILLRELSSQITTNNSNAAVYFASNLTQKAGIYASRDGRQNHNHGIFTYYFVSALKSGRTTTGEILGSLQRNVTFTSRRLFDRAQDPQMFGNSSIQLIPENE